MAKGWASLENKGEGLAFIEERRMSGGVVLNESSLEECKSSGLWWLLTGWVVAGQGKPC